jgi:outer membrane biosynthesis protein TonB
MADPKSIDELLALARAQWSPSAEERARVREFASALSSGEPPQPREAWPTESVHESRVLGRRSVSLLLAALVAPAVVAGLLLRNRSVTSEGGVPAGDTRGAPEPTLEAKNTPAPPQTWAPVRIVDGSAALGQSLLAINPNQQPYVITLPNEYAQPGSEYHALVKICVAPDGSVSGVKILKPSNPVIDRQIERVIPLWRYRPYFVDGHATGFCYSLDYRVGAAPRE